MAEEIEGLADVPTAITAYVGCLVPPPPGLVTAHYQFNDKRRPDSDINSGIVSLTICISNGTLAPTSQFVGTEDFGDGPNSLPMIVKDLNSIPTRSLVDMASEKLIVRLPPLPRPEGAPDSKNPEWVRHIAQAAAEVEFLGHSVTWFLMDNYFDGDRNQAHVWMRRMRSKGQMRDPSDPNQFLVWKELPQVDDW